MAWNFLDVGAGRPVASASSRQGNSIFAFASASSCLLGLELKLSSQDRRCKVVLWTRPCVLHIRASSFTFYEGARGFSLVEHLISAPSKALHPSSTAFSPSSTSSATPPFSKAFAIIAPIITTFAPPLGAFHTPSTGSVSALLGSDCCLF